MASTRDHGLHHKLASRQFSVSQDAACTRGHIAKVITPITKVISTIVGSLYVDNTILLVLKEDTLNKRDLLVEAQAALTDWGDGLIAS